jgi:hypothetical protein
VPRLGCDSLPLDTAWSGGFPSLPLLDGTQWDMSWPSSVVKCRNTRQEGLWPCIFFWHEEVPFGLQYVICWIISRASHPIFSTHRLALVLSQMALVMDWIGADHSRSSRASSSSLPGGGGGIAICHLGDDAACQPSHFFSPSARLGPLTDSADHGRDWCASLAQLPGSLIISPWEWGRD